MISNTRGMKDQEINLKRRGTGPALIVDLVIFKEDRIVLNAIITNYDYLK